MDHGNSLTAAATDERRGCARADSKLVTTGPEFMPDIRALIDAQGRGGFGLLTRAAIFPHFDKRRNEAGLKFSAAHPDQLAIGIDEDTALIIKGDRAEGVGLGTLSMYDGTGRGAPRVVVFRSGDRDDLAARRKSD
jgi:cyanophycinase-like exopeptidase